MEKQIESIISQNLIELRKNRNLKQSELSEAIGYSDKTISRWENGTSTPDIGTLLRLAEFYEITIEDLIKENAVNKAIEVDEKNTQEVLARNVSIPTLSTLTIWLIAAIVYIGGFIIYQQSFWQAFVWAVPISTFFMYRNIKKVYNIKWVNILMLTIIIVGMVTAAYLQIKHYAFWQIFLLIIPLECMAVISVLFGRNEKTRKEKQLEKKKLKKEKQ